MKGGQVEVLSYLMPALTTIAAFILTYNSFFTIFVLAGGIFILLGNHMNNKFYVQTGFILLISFFFFINRAMLLDLFNIVSLITVFFMAYLSWTLAEKKMLVQRLRIEHEGKEGLALLRETERDITMELFSNVSVSMAVSIVGSMVAFYSFVGVPRHSIFFVPLVLVFTAVGFGLFYIIIWYIPNLNEEEDFF